MNGTTTRLAAAMGWALVGAVAVSVAGCQDTAPPSPPPSVAQGERLIVKAEATPEFKPVAAVVTTRDMAQARARIGGTLARLAVDEGDWVRKGQLIGVVTDDRLAMETRGYEAAAAAAAAEARRADADLARAKTLYDAGFVAKARLDEAEAAAVGAQGRLKAAQAQRAASAEQQAQGAILAPTDGRVLHADVPPGSVVSAGQSVATITSGEVLLRLEVPEADARGLSAGTTVLVREEDAPGVSGKGVISQVYPAVAAGRVVADIKVPGLDGALIGRRVRVQAPLGKRQALLVPARFVATRHGVDFVRVLSPGGGAADIPVQVGRPAGSNQVEILSGLSSGDTILAPASGR